MGADEAGGSSWFRWGLLLMTWSLAFWFFIHIEFGAVFFILSGIVFIFTNLRTEERKPGEISAYAAFNKDGFRIP
eukprot:g6014.t1